MSKIIILTSIVSVGAIIFVVGVGCVEVAVMIKKLYNKIIKRVRRRPNPQRDLDFLSRIRYISHT